MVSQQKPKLFYGFYIVGACFIILYMLWGMVLNTFPIFLKPITTDMNWGRGALLVALLMGAVGSAISAPVAGMLIDRLGAKPVMMAGTLMVGLGLLAGSQITRLWELYIIFAFIGCGLMCASIIPCSLIISNWFVSRRGAAMSGAFVGTSVGGMVMSPIANWIIIKYGWRTAFAFSGVTSLVVVIPTIYFLIRTRPSEMGLEPYRLDSEDPKNAKDNWGVTVKEALSLPVFWQIAAIMLLIGLVTSGVGNNCPAYLSDLGHSSTRAAMAWSFVMLIMILGKIVFGPLADSWGARKATAMACAMFAIGIVIVLFARPYAIVLVFAAVYGFASGAPLVLNPLLISGNLGMKNFGALYGVLNIMGTIGGAIGPVSAGMFFDRQGTYVPVFYLFIGAMLVAAAVALSINPVRHESGVISS